MAPAWFFTMVQEKNDDWLIRNLHLRNQAAARRGSEHYPQTLVMENIARQRQELLYDSLPGGMMGGYIEDGFPFYFINLPDARIFGL